MNFEQVSNILNEVKDASPEEVEKRRAERAAKEEYNKKAPERAAVGLYKQRRDHFLKGEKVYDDDYGPDDLAPPKRNHDKAKLANYFAPDLDAFDDKLINVYISLGKRPQGSGRMKGEPGLIDMLNITNDSLPKGTASAAGMRARAKIAENEIKNKISSGELSSDNKSTIIFNHEKFVKAFDDVMKQLDGLKLRNAPEFKKKNEAVEYLRKELGDIYNQFTKLAPTSYDYTNLKNKLFKAYTQFGGKIAVCVDNKKKLPFDKSRFDLSSYGTPKISYNDKGDIDSIEFSGIDYNSSLGAGSGIAQKGEKKVQHVSGTNTRNNITTYDITTERGENWTKINKKFLLNLIANGTITKEYPIKYHGLMKGSGSNCIIETTKDGKKYCIGKPAINSKDPKNGLGIRFDPKFEGLFTK